MDDGKSDAKIVALAVRGVCRSLYLKAIALMTQRYDAETKQRFSQEAADKDIELIETAILTDREKTPVPARRPIRPEIPPPMIPPG